MAQVGNQQQAHQGKRIAGTCVGRWTPYAGQPLQERAYFFFPFASSASPASGFLAMTLVTLDS